MGKLTTRQIQHLEQQLRAERADLLDAARAELLRAEDDAYTAIAGEVPDVCDQATATSITDFDNEIARRHGEALRDIDEALQRIAERSYGECPDCGSEIGYGRLAAFPTASRCVSCQTVRERVYAHAARPTL
jgi:RNA polymerase-binding transcription factor